MVQRLGASLGSTSIMFSGRTSVSVMFIAWQKSTATISCWKNDLHIHSIYFLRYNSDGLIHSVLLCQQSIGPEGLVVS